MEIFGFDAYSPREIAGRVRDACVAKARLPLLCLWMLGMLGILAPVVAGKFVGGGVPVALVCWVIYLRGRRPGDEAPGA